MNWRKTIFLWGFAPFIRPYDRLVKNAGARFFGSIRSDIDKKIDFERPFSSSLIALLRKRVTPNTSWEQLSHQPTSATRNRRILVDLTPSWQANPPIWELRVGGYRVFYDVRHRNRRCGLGYCRGGDQQVLLEGDRQEAKAEDDLHLRDPKAARGLASSRSPAIGMNRAARGARNPLLR